MSAESHLLPELIPSETEVVRILEETGALRRGHFRYPNGLYSDLYLQVALAMRQYQYAKRLSVALSRKLRKNSEIRAIIPQLSVVSPATGGLPVAYGILEALGANQIYWAEEDQEGKPQRFRQFIEPSPGEKILIVDDILRTGKKLQKMLDLLEKHRAQVMGIAVMVYQPTPLTPKFEGIPLYYLAKLDAMYFRSVAEVNLRPGESIVDVWV
ncbi:MAG: phosphoribosyltransferase family protein [Bryobacteraceae bacterium]|nr:phosphoribosyltransferase family protein [Bryobacteraceae bacterium]